MTQHKIGRYEIRDEIGEGGMGTVYRAFDSSLEREVALKVLQPQLFANDPEFAARFEREAKIVAALDHASIVSIYDFGQDGEWLYFVMRLMAGGTLQGQIQQEPLTLGETIAIFERIGSALDKAHSVGIVHRDLKPANILFDAEGKAYLSDFGIVKMVGGDGLITRTGQALGTPHYMSSEQLDGKEIDGRSDIYSLGVILFQMLTGELPYDHESTVRIIVMHLTHPVPNISEIRSDLPVEVGAVIEKAMAKEPQDRYQKVSELVAALQAAANPPEVSPTAVPQPKATITSQAAVTQPITRPKPTVTSQTAAKQAPATAETPATARQGGIPKWVYAIGGLLLIGIIIVAGMIFVSNRENATSANPDVVRVGVNANFPRFGSLNDNGDYEGFNIDLATEIVRRLYGNSTNIEWIPLAASERWTALENDAIDMMVNNSTHTTAREELALWSDNYFLDGLRLLVRRDSGITELKDIHGGTICVTSGYYELAATLYMADQGIDVEILDFAASDDAMDSFINGRCDGFTSDWTFIISKMYAYGLDSNEYQIIDEFMRTEKDSYEYGIEPLAIGIPLGQEDFRNQVNKVLSEMFNDGAWQNIYDKWIPEDPPWTITEMRDAPPRRD